MSKYIGKDVTYGMFDTQILSSPELNGVNTSFNLRYKVSTPSSILVTYIPFEQDPILIPSPFYTITNGGSKIDFGETAPGSDDYVIITYLGKELGTSSIPTLLTFADGNVTNPALAFASEPGAGIYKSGSGQISFASGGAEKIRLASDGRLLLSDGGLTTPSLSFISDSNSGFYRKAAEKIAFIVNGQPALSVDGSSAAGGVGRFIVGDIGGGTPASRIHIFQTSVGEINGPTGGITIGGANSSEQVQIYKSGSNAIQILARTKSTTYVETTVNSYSTALTPASGTLTVNTKLGTILLGELSASVTTWAFTEVPTENNTATNITLVLEGDSTKTYGDACSINGSSISGGILWSGGSAPTSTDGVDIIKFTIIKDSSNVLKVLGSGITNFT